MTCWADVYQTALKALIKKSGVQEWSEPEKLAAIKAAAIELANAVEECEMPKKVLYTEMDGTPKQIVFADHAGDFSPANDLRKSTDGSLELDVQLTLAGLANGSYRQSAKFDFGENWATDYRVRSIIECAATPTAGRGLNLHLACSDSATAGTGNDGGTSGSDAAYTGYNSNAAASALPLQLASSLIVTANATPTLQCIPGYRFAPTGRYGILIVHNDTGAALHSDDVEMHIVFNPVVGEIQ